MSPTCKSVGVLLVLLAGCTMTTSCADVPEAAATFPAPPTADVAHAFRCTRATLDRLAREDALWDHPVTREDAAAGVLETGHFDDNNVSGYRLQLRYPPDGDIALHVRAAGAYFVDQGAQHALDAFRAALEPCLRRESGQSFPGH